MQNMNWRKELSKISALAAPLLISVAVGGATVGWSSPVQAQEQEVIEAGSTPSDEEVAKQVLALIRSANTAYDAKDYPKAFEKYEEAYALYPDPAILVRLGKTAEKMDENAKAVGYYKEFVRLLPDDPTSKELLKTISNLENNAAVELTVITKPSGATVFVDAADEPIDGVTPATVELKPGKYELRIEKEGFESSTESVKVVAGQGQEVSVELTRQMLADSASANFASETIKDVDGPRLDIYGWTTLGLGAATLATSGVFYALASSDENDVNNYNKRAPGASPGELQDLKDSAETNYSVSTVTAITGGVLAAAGVALVTYHYVSADDEDTGPSIAWGLDTAADSKSAWVGINGSF